jgi:hypothetical protein
MNTRSDLLSICAFAMTEAVVHQTVSQADGILRFGQHHPGGICSSSVLKVSVGFMTGVPQSYMMGVRIGLEAKAGEYQGPKSAQELAPPRERMGSKVMLLATD